MSDNARIISLALHEVKRQIHAVQVDPKIRGIDPYVSVKAVDAIIAVAISKYSEGDGNDS